MEILRECCQEFRKTEEPITEERHGNLNVVTIHHPNSVSEMPDVFDKRIDTHFYVVGVNTQKANEYRDEIIQIMRDYPTLDRLVQGPSYIEVGGEMGDQGIAMTTFAVLEAIGLADIMTPAKLGMTGPQADEMAGRGFVMLIPKPELNKLLTAPEPTPPDAAGMKQAA